MITNFKNLAKTALRKKALLIADAGYEAIDIQKSVDQKIKIKNNFLEIVSAMTYHSTPVRLNLDNYKKIFIIGIGKGSALASMSLAKILGKRLTGGIILDVIKLNAKPYPLNAFIGTHPLPSKENVKASREIIELAKGLGKGDLLINFICGGGSALFCGSESELNASKTVFNKLTEAGADIFEMNTVRKHVSDVKGGGLAKIAYPADVVSLIASDVLGNDLSMVASGPTVLDKSTIKDAEKILKKYNLSTSNVVRLLEETPKEEKYFKNVKNILFVSNKDALLAMAEKAKKLGFKPRIASYALKGEAKDVLDLLADKVLRQAQGKRDVVLAGGETTVKLGKALRRAQGKGGRNMEAVLGMIDKFKDLNIKNSIVLSFASDGHDNTEAAGAVGDVFALKKSEKMKLDAKKFLDSHDSFNFFKKTGNLIYADKKSFNVADLMLVLKSMNNE